MLGLDTRALRVIWTALVVAATLGLIYVLRHLLVLLAFSVFLAYLVFPLVSIVQRVFHVRHRAVAIGLVYLDRKSTRLNSSHITISYAVFCLKKKNKNKKHI